MPFFTIVIPSYNRARMISACIESVRNQTFTDWEVIVVDDGSTDNTREVVEQIADKRIRYIYQDNKERSAARNNGARSANGIYVIFLDSDDQFTESHLQILYQNIEEKDFPEALFFTNYLLVDRGKIIENELPDLGTEDPVIYFLNNPVIPARTCIHKNILAKFSFREDIVIVEDTVLWTTIAIHYPVFHIYAKTILYHFHDDNSVNLKNNFYLPRLKGLKKLFDMSEVAKRIPYDLKKKLISDAYYGMARYHEFKRNFISMLFNLIKSFFYYPVHPQNKAKLYMIYQFFRRKGNA